MKRTPKTTRRERQTTNGKGPANAHFTKGMDYTFVTPATAVKRKGKADASDRPQCVCGASKFYTVDKAKKTYACRYCNTVKVAA